MGDSLRQFIEQVTGESHLRVEQDLGGGFVRLRSEEAERRQAKHDIRNSEDIVIEMLRNSRDSGAKNIYLACWKEGSVRNITVIDDGSGIPETMFERIFEARVTSKLDTMCMDLWGVHGRGMALYAIKTNTDDTRVLCSKLDGGTAMHVKASTDKLGEKRDQSAFPVFTKDAQGVVTVRGPKNINRTVLEFAYIERENCNVYLGSVAEIAAALWRQSLARLPKDTIVFCNDLESLDICDRLALAGTPDEFAEYASTLGLPMSSRTARRIMDEQIKPAENAYDSLCAPKGAHYQSDLAKPQGIPSDKAQDMSSAHQSRIRISPEDRERFTQDILEAYAKLAESYFLSSKISPEVKVTKDMLVISIPILNE